jgi:hypothetical protein
MADEKMASKANLGVAGPSARFAVYNFESLALPLSSLCQGPGKACRSQGRAHTQL